MAVHTLNFATLLLALVCISPAAAQRMSVSSVAHCDPGWTKYGGIFCYKYFATEKETPDEAEARCQSNGGHLTSVVNSVIMPFLISKGVVPQSASYLIGLRNFCPKEHTFEWMDGQRYTTKNWKSDDEVKKDGRCVRVLSDNDPSNKGKWVTTSCTGKTIEYDGFVCKTPLKGFYPYSVYGRMRKCSPGWCEYNGDCFKAVHTQTPYAIAKDRCEEDGATVASIHSAAENDFVTQLVTVDDERPMAAYWLGFQVSEPEAQKFQWNDDSPVNYTNWNTGRPVRIRGFMTNCVQLQAKSINTLLPFRRTSNVGKKGHWVDSYCGARNGFVCKKRSRFYAQLPPTKKKQPISIGGCEDDWFRFEGRCYRLYGRSDSAKNFEDAKKQCISEKALLVSIRNIYEQLFVATMLDGKNQSWIGLEYSKDKHKIVWTDGSEFHFSNWNKYFDSANMSCALIDGMTAHWDALTRDACSKATQSFVCTKAVNTSKEPLAPHCTNTSKYCYDFGDFQVKTFNESEKYCKEKFGLYADLASIDDNYDHALVVSAAKSVGVSKFWIGLKRDSKIQYLFKWTDGVPLALTKWAAEEPMAPKQYGEDCVAVQLDADNAIRGAEWLTERCSSRLPYLCKVHPALAPHAAVDYSAGHCTDHSDNFTAAKAPPQSAACFYVSKNHTSFDEAQDSCENIDATLASFHSDEEVEAVSDTLKTLPNKGHSYFFIGMVQGANGRDGFEWLDGSPVNFNKLTRSAGAVGYQYTRQRCVVMGQGGSWVYWDCSRSNRPFICSKPKDMRPPTTPATTTSVTATTLSDAPPVTTTPSATAGNRAAVTANATAGSLLGARRGSPLTIIVTMLVGLTLLGLVGYYVYTKRCRRPYSQAVRTNAQAFINFDDLNDDEDM